MRTLLISAATIDRAHRRADYRRRLRAVIVTYRRARNDDRFLISSVERVYRAAVDGAYPDEVYGATVARLLDAKAIDGADYRAVLLYPGDGHIPAHCADDTHV